MVEGRAEPREAAGLAGAKAQMLRTLERRGIGEPTVLAAMESVPREHFVGGALREHAYDDCALPIGLGQTISQPYIVALMTERAGVGPGSRVLEIGTGCGYQTAVLAALGADVYSVEILAPLAAEARERLRELGLRAHIEVGDGALGLPAHAPYDAILVTAAPREVPRALVAQLAPEGRLVIPVGDPDADQELLLVRRTAAGAQTEHIAPVRFVPMTR